jgi:hypothetical protein
VFEGRLHAATEIGTRAKIEERLLKTYRSHHWNTFLRPKMDKMTVSATFLSQWRRFEFLLLADFESQFDRVTQLNL